MILGVFSDVHDHLENLQKALDAFSRAGAGTLIFCGDFCSPIPARAIGAYDGEVHCVFGNGDGDRFAILRWVADNAPHMHLHGEHAELSFGEVNVAVTHYPLYGRALARTGDYRAVFSGHTHERHEERFGDCLWLNPGEILGFKGRPTCATYETETGRVTTISL